MKYTHLLPFMDKSELKTVANQIINGEIKNVRIESFYPFLRKEDLNEIVDQMIEHKKGQELQSALPFISKDKVLAIYQAAQKGELEDFDPTSCIPFLGADKIKEIFNDLIKNASLDDEEDV